MNMDIKTMVVAFMFAVGVLVPAENATASLISDAQVDEQEMVHAEAERKALLEELKLVQMLFIQLLGERISQLSG